MGFCLSGVLSEWGYVRVGFRPVGLCPVGLCPSGVLSWIRIALVPDNYLVYIIHQAFCITKCESEKWRVEGEEDRD